MPDFRIDDTAPEHRKMRAAGLPALGLWSMAGAWSSSPTQMTDGWIPLYWVQTWPSGKKAADKLVKVGLWHEAEREGLPGYQFHDWADFQRTAASWEAEKQKARERMQAIRSGSVRANKNRTSERTLPERAPHVPDSLTLTQQNGDHLGGERPVPARASAPPPRCAKHTTIAALGPCRACADARQARAEFDTAQAAAVEAERLAISRCRLCDGDGRRWDPVSKARGTVGPCDHKPQPHQETA